MKTKSMICERIKHIRSKIVIKNQITERVKLISVSVSYIIKNKDREREREKINKIPENKPGLKTM
jgi:hypothetical protein